jgi:2,4-dienoyl-CoA reductase-like NADH-dependent reductase (Old Yellow Enzyme family)
VEPDSTAWQILFTPTRIRGVGLKNRFVFQPHYTALSTFDGMPTDRLAAYYEERARGAGRAARFPACLPD